MPITPFNFCGGTYSTRDRLFANERAINFYPSIDESGHAQSKIELSPAPGLATVCTLPFPPTRGFWVGDNRLFAVAAGEVHEISSTGVPTKKADILNAATPVQIASNGESLLIATGDQIWYVPGTGAATRVADGISCAYIDGYYIILWPDSNTIQISTDGINWDPLDTVTKIGTVDRVTRLEAHEGHLWMFGRRTIVPWYDSGNADFPFEPISGATMDQGTMAPWSVTAIDQRLYWLGTDLNGQGRVFRSEGYRPVRISNMAIEHLIGQYLSLGVDQLITGSGYEENGHTFYTLSFPKAGATLVYDLNTEMWHERARWNGTSWEQWRGASFHAFCFGKHYAARMHDPPYAAGDEAKIYEQSLSIYTDDGNPIRRYRSAPYVAADQQWLFHHYLRLFVNGSTPVSMRYQLDDAVTWSNTRTVTPLKNEVKYRRLGRARDRLYEVWLTDSDTSSQPIIEAYLHASPGVER
jgi:hypothetical protein